METPSSSIMETPSSSTVETPPKEDHSFTPASHKLMTTSSSIMETPPTEDHSFTPANHKLITAYLRRRAAGEPLPSATAAYFHDTDIYAAEPAALTAGLQPLPARNGEGNSWLFFTPVKAKSSTDARRSRRVGGGVGTWHSEHAPEAVVDGEGNRVGHRQLFSYRDKAGRRSGWSMWEFGAADQGGGETLLVLCKVHQQAHTGSRRAGGSAARSARKRKGADDDGDKMASGPVRRRLFAPATPAPPAASEDMIDATSEAIRSSRSEKEPSLDKIDAKLEASNSMDTPISLMSFWNEPYLLQHDKTNTTLRSICSFSPGPNASHENTISRTMECPGTACFLIPEPEAIPSSRTETEASNDGPRSVTSFWGEPNPLQPGRIVAALRSLGSLSPRPDASPENAITTTMETPTSFLIPLPEASQGETTAAFDRAFLIDGGAPPPAPEYPYSQSFTDGDVSRVSLFPPGAETSGPWTGYDAMPSSCTVGNAFPTLFDEFGAGASGSWTGYAPRIPPMYREWGIPGSAGVQYGCTVPSATFLLPPAPPFQWCGGPAPSNC